MPRLIAVLLAVTLLLAAGPAWAEADPAAPAGTEAPPVSKAVDEAQKAAIMTVLKSLHGTYEARDVKGVLGLIQEVVDRTAREYQAGHPEDPKAEEAIRDAFVAFHEDIFRHEGYHLLAFEPRFADFKPRTDGSVEVVSNVPIIGTEDMTFDDNGTPATVHLRLGRFVLRPEDGTWRIVEMNLF